MLNENYELDSDVLYTKLNAFLSEFEMVHVLRLHKPPLENDVLVIESGVYQLLYDTSMNAEYMRTYCRITNMYNKHEITITAVDNTTQGYPYSICIDSDTKDGYMSYRYEALSTDPYIELRTFDESGYISPMLTLELDVSEENYFQHGLVHELPIPHSTIKKFKDWTSTFQAYRMGIVLSGYMTISELEGLMKFFSHNKREILHAK